MLEAGRGDTKDYWGMWWIDVLVAGRGDTRDYWGMGSMGLWTVGLLCAPSAGLFYMWFSPTRGWIVLHEVFSYTWVGFLLVYIFLFNYV